MGNFILWNGEIIPKNQATVPVYNRGTLYGDGLFETMRCKGVVPPFYALHWNRLESGLKYLKMNYNEAFTKKTLFASIQKLIRREKLFKACSIRINCFRKEGGKYTPEKHEIDYFIEAFPLESTQFTLNKKGLKVGLFEEIPKPLSPLSNIKHSNALPLILAGIHKTEKEWDECFLLNTKDSLVEAVSSNLYIKIKNRIITPSLDAGCVNGTIRKIMPAIVQKAGFVMEEHEYINPEILDEAEEVFISNAVSGIQWIVAYNKKRYFYQTAQLLNQLLNEHFEEKHAEMADF